MAHDIEVFSNAPLPAYLANTDVAELNGALTSHVSVFRFFL